MASFGERLRAEREARKTTIEEVSAATGIQPDYLAALEKNDFHSLPGRAFGKFYIRAYAKTLGIDPDQLLDEYDREQDSRRRASVASTPVEAARPRQAETVIQRWRLAAVAEREKAIARAAMLAQERASVPAAEEGAYSDYSEVHEGGADEVSASEPILRPPTPTSPTSPHSPPSPPSTPRPLVAALVFLGLFMVAASVYVVFFRTSLEGSEKAATNLTKPVMTPPPAAAGPPAPPVTPGPVPAPTAPVKKLNAAPASKPTRAAPSGIDSPGSLSVSESGLGRRLAHGVAAGSETQFSLWDVVGFSTRVLGARPGDKIEHVWLHEGRVMQSIELRLGGATWRTQSRKTLGKPGEWAVEARDSEGRVLARATFTCEPPRP